MCIRALIERLIPADDLVLKRWQVAKTGATKANLSFKGKQNLDKLKSNYSSISEFIFDLLGIADSKSSSLLGFNGILLAFLALLLQSENIKIEELKHDCLLLTIVFSIFVSLTLSILVCLFVAGIFWRFHGLVVPNSYDPGTEVDAVEEIEMLTRVLLMRERLYQLSWMLSLLSVFLIWALVLLRYFK